RGARSGGAPVSQGSEPARAAHAAYHEGSAAASDGATEGGPARRARGRRGGPRRDQPRALAPRAHRDRTRQGRALRRAAGTGETEGRGEEAKLGGAIRFRMAAVSRFLDILATGPRDPHLVFNPWRDHDERDRAPRRATPAMRLENMQEYLESRARSARILLLGEAPSHRARPLTR